MFKAINPATGEVVREQAPLTPEQTERAIEAADNAYKTWRTASFSDRAFVLRGVASAMRADLDRLASLMTQEMGKPIREARGEVEKAIWCAEHFAENAAAYLESDSIASDARHSYVQYLPLGVTLGILPWNAPFWLAFRYCAPALMAGNACLMKHDPHVPGCAEAIANLFEEADAPKGLFQNLPIETEHVAAVIRDRRVAAVSLTGSDRAGSAVAALAGEMIKPVVLELGGSDAAIVLDDADLDAAAETIALSRVINAGQSCIAAKRVIVEESIHDAFVVKLDRRLAAFKLGDPRDEATDVGPIARADLRDNLHGQLTRSVEEGAFCPLGGKIPEGPGFFYPVSLLTGVKPGMTCFKEETFGPVAPVIRAKNATDALQMANDSKYGLAAAVWTSAARGEAMARDLVVGQVAVNGIVKTDPRLPSGGVRRSGVGRELGPHGIHEFVNAQQVWIGPKRR